MPQLLAARRGTEANSLGAFTIRTTITAHGRAVEQTQLVTEHYVITTLAGSTLVYAPGLGGRFLVERSARRLKPIDASAQNPPPQQIRSLLGELVIEQHRETVEVDGHQCRRLTVHNRNARMVLSIETYCARVDGLEMTALGNERAFDAPHQPFHLPLDDDELLVRSTTRALAADFEQSQTLQLTSIESHIEGRESYEEVLRYPIVSD